MSHEKGGEQQPQDRGFWVPAEIWDLPNVTLTERVFLCRIWAYEERERGCFMSNASFGRFFDVATKSAANVIAALSAHGIIRVEVTRDENAQVVSRCIRVNPEYVTPVWARAPLHPGNRDTPPLQAKGDPSPRPEGGPPPETRDRLNIDDSKADSKLGESKKNTPIVPTREPDLSSPANAGRPPTPTEIQEIWNRVVGKKLPNVVALTPAREKKVRYLIGKYLKTAAEFEAYAKRIAATPFLTGQNDRGWRADFDFAINPARYANVVEGKYDRQDPDDIPYDYSQGPALGL